MPCRPDGLFWDYSALPQEGADWNEAMAATRLEGLRVMHRLYGCVLTGLLRLSYEVQCIKERPYWSRGWCIMESIVASLQKEHNFQVVDLGDGRVRQPPIGPECMRRILLHQCKFTNG